MLRTVSRVDYQPISEDGIEELIASGEPLDVDYVMNQAASTQRGLGAVEYLAFDDPAIAAEPRRCELLSATAEVVAAETATLEAAWATGHDGNPPFAEAFAGENMPSNDALGELISSIVETLKQQSLFQVGKAIGVSSPQPEPEAIPEGSSGSAASFYHAQLDAIRSMLDSGTPNSLAELIAARSPEVGARIDEQLDDAMAELDGVEAPMREIAREDPASLEPLYEHLYQLLGLFESDVVSLLDVTLGFSDTDGDSG
jgi:predicted lipoprotein